jgi:hypothetical protein
VGYSYTPPVFSPTQKADTALMPAPWYEGLFKELVNIVVAALSCSSTPDLRQFNDIIIFFCIQLNESANRK